MDIFRKFIFSLLFCISLHTSAQTYPLDVDGLVILVNFADSGQRFDSGNTSIPTYAPSNYITPSFNDPIFQINNMYNALDHTDVFGNVGSVRDYFLDMSSGSFDLNTTIIMVDLPHNRGCFDGGTCSGGPNFNAQDNFSYAYVWDPYQQETKGVLTTNGGTAFNLQKEVICRLVGCPTENIDVNYYLYEPGINRLTLKESTSSATNAFDFESNVSTKESIYMNDWLDIEESSGLNRSWFERELGNVVEHYNFIQIVYQGTDGGTAGVGLWPRALPFLDPDAYSAPEINSTPLGIVGFVPIGDLGGASHGMSIGTIVHEAGHSLFGFKDLYDTQFQGLRWAQGSQNTGIIDDIHEPSGNVWFKSYGVSDYSLMGGVRDPERNPPLINAQHRELVGWEAPVDLKNASEGDIFEVTWNPSGPNQARSYKYCKPRSTINECLYIEARAPTASRSNPGASSTRTIFSPDYGLIVWHAENYFNPVDFGVNKHKESTPGLHFGTAVIEADGNSDLLGIVGSTGFSHSGDLFHQGGVDQFTGRTWWDGTPIGLELINVSSIGNTMSFEIGPRPLKPVIFEFPPFLDVSVTGYGEIYDGDRLLMPVGEEFTFTVEHKYVNLIPSYKVYSSNTDEPWENSFFVGDQTLTGKSTFDTNFIKVVGSNEQSENLEFEFTVDHGAVLSYVDSGGALNTIGEFPKSIVHQTLNLIPSRSTNVGGESLNFDIEMLPGFELVSWSVTYKRDNPQDLVINGTGETLWLYTFHHTKTSQPIEVTVTTRRIPGYLCTPGAVEDWVWYGVYKEVGTYVRDQNEIYRTIVPRATITENRIDFAILKDAPSTTQAQFNNFHQNPTRRPEDAFKVFERVEDCSANLVDCSGLSLWEPGVNYPQLTEVKYRGKRWKLWNDEVVVYDGAGGTVLSVDTIPGSYADLVPSYTKKIPNSGSSYFDLGPASIGSDAWSGNDAPWELIGNCL